MSLSLPPTTHPAREHVDIDLLASLGDPQMRRQLPTLRQARDNAARAFAADDAIRRIHTVVMRADGNVELISIGPRGGWRTAWRFGQICRPTI